MSKAGGIILLCALAIVRLSLWYEHREKRFDPEDLHPPTEPDFGAFDRAAIKRAMQGITLYRDSGDDTIVSVTGDAITTTHGADTDKATIEISSPCSLEEIGRVDVTSPIVVLPDGARMAWVVAISSDDRTVACLNDLVIVQDNVACHVWQAGRHGGWQRSDTRCRVAKIFAGVTLDVGTEHVALPAVGAGRWASLGADQVVHPASFAEAKAIADADLRAMREALATAPTFEAIADAPELAAGIHVKVDAYVRAIDEDTHTVTLAATRDAKAREPTVTCAATAPRVRAGDRVAISGTLVSDDAFVHLDACTISPPP
jgi:hypothetical protein